MTRRRIVSAWGPRTLGPVGTLATRRVWRDRWLVAASVVVVGLASFLAYAGPHLVLGTLDDGAADALSGSGARPTIDLTFAIGNTSGDNVTSVRGLGLETVDAAAQVMADNIPPATASIVTGYELSAQEPELALVGITDADEVSAAEAEDRLPSARTRRDAVVTMGYVADLDAVATEGRLPSMTPDQMAQDPDQPDPSPLEVALTASVASELDVEIGDQLSVASSRGVPLDFVVVGIVDLSANEAVLDASMPEVLAPFTTEAGTATDRTHVGLVLTSDAAAAYTDRTRSPLEATLRLTVDPAKLTLDLSRQIPSELQDLATHSEDLIPGAGITPRLDTTLADALDGYPVRAHSALAQMSILIAGVVAAAAGVIALMAQLTVSARRADIALERARGASVTTTAVTLLLEHAVVTAVGVGLGYGVAHAMAPGADPLDPLVGFVAVVSLLAAPTLGAHAAREMWRGRRAPANRTDRMRHERAQRARSTARDGALIGATALAVMSLRDRDVLTSSGDGIDIFLSAGPVLVALSAAVVVVRSYPGPMRVVQALARNTRRIGGLLVLARARERVAPLPLITLALSIAVAASGSLIATTVHEGQERASWQLTGADARIEGSLAPAQIEALADAGLTVSSVAYAPSTTVALGSNLEPTTVLAVDSHFADVVDAAGLPGADELRSLAQRAASWAPGEPLPALASPSVSAMDIYDRSDAFLGKTYVPIDIEGEASTAADGWADGPYVIVPLEALLLVETDEQVGANLAFVSGHGADTAIAGLRLPAEDVVSRAAWLDATRGSALMGGVQEVMMWAVSAVAALAAVGLLVSVIDGSRRRSRALALLRTQGVGIRYGWLLAAADLVPVIVAAAAAGAAGAGLAVWLLSGTMGLGILTGELTPPVLAINATHLAFGAGGLAALACAAVLAEVGAGRRSKLSEVLRYGETR